MRFINDDQRKAVFANLNRFSDAGDFFGKPLRQIKTKGYIELFDPEYTLLLIKQGYIDPDTLSEDEIALVREAQDELEKMALDRKRAEGEELEILLLKSKFKKPRFGE
jgi:hypothetical protein